MTAAEEAPQSEIVVGLDESPAGRAALSWAADYARLTGSGIRAIHVRDATRPLAGWIPAAGPTAQLPDPEMAQTVTDRIEEAVRQAFRAVGPEPGWRLEIIDGEPGQVLLEEAHSARLLVIGTQTRSGLERLISGSVSHHCLSRAERPVVAVPAPEEDPAG